MDSGTISKADSGTNSQIKMESGTSSQVKMESGTSSRTTSQIVYTSVDDDMTVTEIICDYDCDGTVPQAICEVDDLDQPENEIYLVEPSNPSEYAPVIKEEKIYLDHEAMSHDDVIKEGKIYIDETGNDALRMFNEEKKFKCGVCCEQFDDLSAISRHMEEHSGEKKYECAECGKQFKSINNVLRHMVIHSGERKYFCPICQKSFTQVGNLKRHMFVHSGEKKFPCNSCGKGFTQMNNLIRHQAIHTGVKNFECNLCHRLFNQLSNLNRHLLIHKGVRLYKCGTCGRAFSQLTNLQKHRERHLRGKKYTCEVCREGFDQKSSFTKHMESHYGKPRYQCGICGRSVTQKSTLSQHMLLHSEDKKYMCDQCDKSYAQKGSLTKHLESHNQVKFPCKVCTRYFYDEVGLAKHLDSHTEKAKHFAGIRETQTKLHNYNLQFCEVCGKSFILKRSLARHMEKVHDIIVEIRKEVTCRENPCEVCGKVFVHRKSLKKHMLRKHNMEIEFDLDMIQPDPDAIVKLEKENDISEAMEETEPDTIVHKDDASEDSREIKIESTNKTETVLKDGEEVSSDVSPRKLNEETAASTEGATVHMCEVCGRGFYLLGYLNSHKKIKHGIEPPEKENVEKNVSSPTSVKEVNNFVLRETNLANRQKKETFSKTGSDGKEIVLKSPVKKKMKNKEEAEGGQEKITPKSKRRTKRKPESNADDADICDLCGRGFLSSVDLLLHMVEHSKAKKNELLDLVNEATQEFRNLKKSEEELSVTEKTKGLVTHFRKFSKSQSSEISSVLSLNEPYQATPPLEEVSPGRSQEVGTCISIAKESIVSECLDINLDVKQEIIEIHEDAEECVLSIDA